MRAITTIAVLTLAALTADGDVLLERPARLIIPDAVYARWSSVEQLPPTPAAGGLELHLPPELAVPRSRIDIFDLKDSQCLWRAAFVAQGPTVSVPATFPVCVLVRQKRIYGFVTVRSPSVSVPVIALHDIELPENESRYALFVAGETEPRQDSQIGRFDAVPVRPALLCRTSDHGADSCTIVDESGVTSPESAGLQGAIRMFLVDSDESDARGLRMGTSRFVPKNVHLAVAAAGLWRAMTADADWAAATVDWRRAGYASARFQGSALSPLPAFVPVRVTPTDGIKVRPVLKDGSGLGSDSEARLALFYSGESVDSVAAAVIAGNADGVFHAPSLAPGRYTLQMISAQTKDASVTAELRTEPTEVQFESGILVRGRIVLRGARAEHQSASVHVARRSGGAAREGNPKEVGWARQITPDESGTFRFSVDPGSYELRASWAGSTARRDFTATDADIDLGDVDLRTAPLLRGTVANCRGGELTLIPLPSPDRTTTVPFFDVRKVPLGDDAKFSVDGLWPGRWIASATCEGVRRDLTPYVININSSDALTLVDFVAAP